MYPEEGRGGQVALGGKATSSGQIQYASFECLNKLRVERLGDKIRGASRITVDRKWLVKSYL